jgi:hypothetical protein
VALGQVLGQARRRRIGGEVDPGEESELAGRKRGFQGATAAATESVTGSRAMPGGAELGEGAVVTSLPSMPFGIRLTNPASAAGIGLHPHPVGWRRWRNQRCTVRPATPPTAPSTAPSRRMLAYVTSATTPSSHSSCGGKRARLANTRNWPLSPARDPARPRAPDTRHQGRCQPDPRATAAVPRHVSPAPSTAATRNTTSALLR